MPLVNWRAIGCGTWVRWPSSESACSGSGGRARHPSARAGCPTSRPPTSRSVRPRPSPILEGIDAALERAGSTSFGLARWRGVRRAWLRPQASGEPLPQRIVLDCGNGTFQALAPGDRVTRRPILLLVNPVAGGKPGSGPGLETTGALEPAALRAALERRGSRCAATTSTADDDAGGSPLPPRTAGQDVVVAGGDGTVVGSPAALVGTGCDASASSRMGSFNNMARGFGVPDTLDAGARRHRHAASAGLVDAGWVRPRHRRRHDRSSRPPASAWTRSASWPSRSASAAAGWRAVRSAARAFGCGARRCASRSMAVAYRTAAPAVTVCNGPYHGLGLAVSAGRGPDRRPADVVVFHGMSRLGRHPPLPGGGAPAATTSSPASASTVPAG